jgi:hypothetical protein
MSVAHKIAFDYKFSIWVLMGKSSVFSFIKSTRYKRYRGSDCIDYILRQKGGHIVSKLVSGCDQAFRLLSNV